MANYIDHLRFVFKKRILNIYRANLQISGKLYYLEFLSGVVFLVSFSSLGSS